MICIAYLAWFVRTIACWWETSGVELSLSIRRGDIGEAGVVTEAEACLRSGLLPKSWLEF